MTGPTHAIAASTRRALVAAATVALLAGCTAPHPPGAAAAPGTTQAAGTAPRATAPAQGCPAPLTGPAPAWAAGPPDLPHVVSREGNAVGLLFAPPLRAGERTDGISNKILWVVREPRDGHPLTIVATRPGAHAVTLTREADSGPGEIYPSIVDVPVPGCWDFTLTWGSHRATLALRYDR